ncbi:MAG: glycosyltransferase family 2 protein [Acidaminococcaceae bacterium]
MEEISVLILARNEEKNMAECIKSCDFAGEIIVIDDFSTDETQKVSESLGARVFKRNMNGDWGGQQTFAIQQATKPWIFFIDADERVTSELSKEIIETVQSGDKFGYWIKRINHFKHKKVDHGPLSPDWVCRLMPTEGSYVTGFVHPKIVHKFSDRRLTKPMLHYTYETWTQYLNKMNQYSELAAKKRHDSGKSFNFLFDIIVRPSWAFFKMYILKQGFLDGKLGYMLCANYANYTMNKYAKLWQLETEGLNKEERTTS